MTTPQHPYTSPLPYTLSTWRECVIWCAMSGGGARACTAQVYGAFGLHEWRGLRGYVITHIPTGKRLVRSMSLDMGKHAVEHITALGDWNTRSVGKLRRLREAM